MSAASKCIYENPIQTTSSFARFPPNSTQIFKGERKVWSDLFSLEDTEKKPVLPCFMTTDFYDMKEKERERIRERRVDRRTATQEQQQCCA